MKEEFEKLVWEPDEANLVFNSVGSLSLSLSTLPLSLYLTSINSHQRRRRLPSQRTYKMGLRPSSGSQLRLYLNANCGRYMDSYLHYKLQGNTERNMRQSEMTTKLKVQPHIFNLRLYKFSVS